MPRKKKEEPQAIQPEDLEEEPGAEDEPVPEEPAPEPVAPVAAELPPQSMVVRVAALREALELVAPAVPSKTNALPITSQVRLGGGRVVATDLEVAVAVRMPEAQVDMLLPHKEALGFLKYAPGHRDAEVTVAKGKTSIVAGGMQIHFKVTDPRDFPPVPLSDPEEMEHQGVLDGDDLVKALSAVLPYASAEESRPVLTGVCLTLGEELKVAAGDGFRLGWETLPGRLPGDGHIILPRGAIVALKHLWKRAATPDLTHAFTPATIAMAKRLIRMRWNKQRIQMDFGRVTLVSQLIDGTFPKYEQLIPPEQLASVTVDAEDMLRALQQLKGRAKEEKGIIRLHWEGDTLGISARSEDYGDVAVSLRAASTAPARTAINISYLLGYFKGKEGEVTVSLTGEAGAPVKFAHRGMPHVVMMPMAVQW